MKPAFVEFDLDITVSDPKEAEAYGRGQRDCEVNALDDRFGDWPVDQYPSNPYPRGSKYWHTYNRGWNDCAAPRRAKS